MRLRGNLDRYCVLAVLIAAGAAFPAGAQQPGSAEYNRVFVPAHGTGDTRRPSPGDRWGAYAVSEVNKYTGFVTGLTTEPDAVAAATAMCVERGGVVCAKEATFLNSCAAVATSESRSRWAIEDSLRAATSAAKEECGRECRIRWSGCSDDSSR
ncbi:DUF4189 domain-containing protein [Luteimonas terrae]|uniref:DUF4189 domain-containing protein n=1 Tax=Luteimonas terrae TaxID=1530191 RepID=UPI003D2F7783